MDAVPNLMVEYIDKGFLDLLRNRCDSPRSPGGETWRRCVKEELAPFVFSVSNMKVLSLDHYELHACPEFECSNTFQLCGNLLFFFKSKILPGSNRCGEVIFRTWPADSERIQLLRLGIRRAFERKKISRFHRNTQPCRPHRILVEDHFLAV